MSSVCLWYIVLYQLLFALRIVRWNSSINTWYIIQFLNPVVCKFLTHHITTLNIIFPKIFSGCRTEPPNVTNFICYGYIDGLKIGLGYPNSWHPDLQEKFRKLSISLTAHHLEVREPWWEVKSEIYSLARVPTKLGNNKFHDVMQ